MRLPALLVSDTHFVDEPACAYRWDLWPWLRKTVKEEKVKTLVHCGDLVDRKDNHPASLVNRLADEVKKTRDETAAEQVYMSGNHDWLKEEEEFFRFLRHLDGVHYASRPWEHPDVKGPLAMFLPYAKSPGTAWKDLHSLEEYDYVFMHQTVIGSRASTGEELSGDALPVELLATARKIYSGDIHVPQVVEGPFGSVEYVGSPYHVHFGDDFAPRVVLLEAGGRAIDLRVPGMPRRVTATVDSLEQLQRWPLRAGDQAKVRLELEPDERHEWARRRREIADHLRAAGVHAYGIELRAVGGSGARVSNSRAARMAGASPEEAVARFVRDEELGGDALDVGLDLL